MKFNAFSSELSKKLAVASIAISPKNIMPVLEDFLLKLEGNNLTINATNLEISISLSVEVTGHEDGEIAVSSKLFLDTLRSLPDQPFTFETLDNNLIMITSSFGKYKMAGDDADEYPSMESIPDSDYVSINSTILKSAIDKTIVAIGESGVVRPSMTGANFMFDFNKMIVVATDSHIMVKYSVTGMNFDTSKTFILLHKGLQLLKNALPEDEQVDIFWSNKKVFFRFGDFLISSSVITDEFPNYNLVIPVDFENVLYVNRKDLLNSLKRLILFSNKSFNLVTLNINEDSLTLASEDIEMSHDATEQMPCKYDGEPVTLGFSAKFFIEILSILDEEEIKMEFSSPKTPVILKPIENADNEDIILLIMPLILKN
ncbi:MAG: DNA polymerase III subunit beta [Deltaproteobacteria bacterium]